MTSWPVVSTAYLTGLLASCSPVFLIVNITAQLGMGIVDPETAAFEDLDDAGRGRILPLTGSVINVRHADHARVSAQVHVRRSRVERPGEFLLKPTADNQVLN